MNRDDENRLGERLGATDLFAALSAKTLRQLASNGHEMFLDAGRTLTEEGDGLLAEADLSPNPVWAAVQAVGQGSGFYLVLEGSAIVERSPKADIVLQAGAYFGEISLIDGRPRTATVKAGPTGLIAFGLSPDAFRPLLAAHPDVGYQLLKVMCARLRAAEATWDDLPDPAHFDIAVTGLSAGHAHRSTGRGTAGPVLP